MLRALPDEYGNSYYVGAMVASAASLLILIYELLTLSAYGQHVLDAIFSFLKQAYIGYLMVVVSFLYIPISRQALGIFICKRQECAQGEWFPLQSPGSESSVWTYLNRFASTYLEAARALGRPEDAVPAAVLAMRPADSCAPCQWLGNERALLPLVASGGNGTAAIAYGDYGVNSLIGSCPADLAVELCPPTSSLRLTAAPQIDCVQQWAFSPRCHPDAVHLHARGAVHVLQPDEAARRNVRELGHLRRRQGRRRHAGRTQAGWAQGAARVLATRAGGSLEASRAARGAQPR